MFKHIQRVHCNKIQQNVWLDSKIVDSYVKLTKSTRMSIQKGDIAYSEQRQSSQETQLVPSLFTGHWNGTDGSNHLCPGTVTGCSSTLRVNSAQRIADSTEMICTLGYGLIHHNEALNSYNVGLLKTSALLPLTLSHKDLKFIALALLKLLNQCWYLLISATQ